MAYEAEEEQVRMVDDGKVMIYPRVKKTYKSPDISGTAVCICPLCQGRTEYEVHLWKQISKRLQKTFFSGLIKEKNEITKKVEKRNRTIIAKMEKQLPKHKELSEDEDPF